MGTIARLYNFVAGTRIRSAEVDAELDSLVTAHNDHDLEIDNLQTGIGLTDGSVATTKLADLGVTTTKLAASAVTTLKIADANVTTAKLSDSAVTLAKMADSSVGTTELVDLSVTTAKIAIGAVGVAQLTPGAAVNESVNNMLITTLSADVVQRGINVKNYGAVGNGVTNDTAAVKAAIAAAVAMRSLLVVSQSFYGGFPTVYFPAGTYLITEKSALTPVIGTDTLKGFHLLGAGFQSTRIIFDSNNADADNYLINNVNVFAYSLIENLWFVAKNSVEKFYRGSCTAGSGRVQSIRHTNCRWDNFMEGFTVDGESTDTGENVWMNCKIEGVPSGGTFLSVSVNNQSVDYNFHGCDVQTISGTGFKFTAGGNLNVFGGSMITSNSGVLIDCTDSTGTKIGTTNCTYNFYGIRSEIRNDSTLFYFSCVGTLTFDGCNLTVTTTGKETINKGTLASTGIVVFRNCRNLYLYTILSGSTTYASVYQPMMLFDGCLLFSQASTLVTTTHTGNNPGGTGKVILDNCRNITNVNEPIDVSLNARLGYNSFSQKKKVYVYRVSPDANSGLPYNQTATFKVPLGSIIRGVVIIHELSGSGGTYDYYVKNYDNSVTFASSLGVVYNTNVNAFSGDLYYVVDTEAKRTINVIESNASHVAVQKGYVMIEYI